MATVRDVAQRAGVSVSLASAALRETKAHVRYSAETRERVLQAARLLGYRRHPLSTALRTGRTRIIGVNLGNAQSFLNHPHSARMVSTCQNALAVRGYAMLILSLGGGVSCDLRLLDGIIIMDSRPEDASAVEDAARSVPTLQWFGGVVRSPAGISGAGEDIHAIVRRRDHETSARYLYDLGHRRIALLEPYGAISGAHTAISIFRRIADERGIAVELDAVYDYLAPRIYPNIMRYLDRPRLPTAFYALDDEVAQRVVDKLSWRGLAVPRDASVFSRQTDEGPREGVPGVTGLLTDWPACWRSLVDQFVEVVEGRSAAGRVEPVIPAQRIVERTTCAPPREGTDGVESRVRKTGDVA